MNFRRLIGILISAFFTIYFIRQIFVREHWSFKVPAILIALVTAAVLVQNIAAIKYGDEKKNDGQISLSKTFGLLVFAFLALLFPQLLFVESHWLFKIPVFLIIIYVASSLLLYMKNNLN
ncbi:hypothetical protein A0U40_12620 [[Bacillus] sp. KCTC 13219]|nr:hypothetical protein A0U40_12620 [[Bacillus] sp. KCTC 13219]